MVVVTAKYHFNLKQSKKKNPPPIISTIPCNRPYAHVHVSLGKTHAQEENKGMDLFSLKKKRYGFICGRATAPRGEQFSWYFTRKFKCINKLLRKMKIVYMSIAKYTNWTNKITQNYVHMQPREKRKVCQERKLKMITWSCSIYVVILCRS